MSTTRTFVAIELDPVILRRAIGLVERLRPYAPGAKWVEEENLHVTLQFVGELSDHEVADACSQAEWAARANPPFTMRVAGVGAFPDLARPKALWLGVSDGADQITRLHEDLDDALGHLIVKRDNRPYVPHLTLARLGGGGRFGGARGGGRGGRSGSGRGSSPYLADTLAGLSDYDAGSQGVDAISVFSSELRREGPEYHLMARCPLGAPG